MSAGFTVQNLSKAGAAFMESLEGCAPPIFALFFSLAGVSIGLATLVQRQLPEIGHSLSTVVLAVISINQIIGPIMFKIALNRVGEAQQ
jgi:hypothetical protein